MDDGPDQAHVTRPELPRVGPEVVHAVPVVVPVPSPGVCCYRVAQVSDGSSSTMDQGKGPASGAAAITTQLCYFVGG